MQQLHGLLAIAKLLVIIVIIIIIVVIVIIILFYHHHHCHHYRHHYGTTHVAITPCLYPQSALITTQAPLLLSVMACHSLERTQANPLYLSENLIS